MDEDTLETHDFSSPNSCCPVPFLNTSPSPGRAPAADSIFNYDIRLLHQQGHTVLDMPLGPSLSEAMDRDRNLDDKLAEGDNGALACSGWECFNCLKSNSPSRTVCGVMCNPLLTSRLALTGLLAILLIVMTVLTWVFTSSNVQQSVQSVAAEYRHELLVHIGDTVSDVLRGNNASAVSLAHFLSSATKVDLSSFTSLQEQVLPALFLGFSILAKKAQVTFFGGNGLLLSYVADSVGSSLIYANFSYLYPPSMNSSYALNFPWKDGENLMLTRPWYKWYRQSIDEITGSPRGEVMSEMPVPYWDVEPVKSSLQGYQGTASWGFSLANSSEALYTYFSPVQQSSNDNPIGAVSIGVPLTSLDDILDQFDSHGGAIYLATSDGQLVAQTGVGSFKKEGSNASQVLPLASESNNAIVAGVATYLTPHLPSIVSYGNGSFTAVDVDIEGTRYMIDSAPLHVTGTTLICVVIIPHKSIWGLTEMRSHTTLAVLVALATCMGLVCCFFVILLTKGVSNEMRLRAALIQQLEETKRAETKSSHKSLVFANMSHDLRTPLAAILGLIDLCLCDVSECSELESNLLQMKSCATNLLGILNSILDMSKIEAGKLLLQESGFDLVSALEEVVDTFSVVGLKKGVEVALDLSDGSLEKVSWVVGDAGRVKQIMANLLSNGVKFTSEGHVVLRAWVKPLGLSSPQPRYSYRGKLLSWTWSQFLRSPSREKEICKLIQGLSEKDLDEDFVQVEFEVDDTGRGIPKERWKSVFENFVQVESSVPRSYDGTGLGLGIVRSLVRLMGGEINIIDKDEPGEPGTRFGFNLIFKRSKQYSKQGAKKTHTRDIQVQDGASLQATFGINSTSALPGWQLESNEASTLCQGYEDVGINSPSIVEGVHVLLAMQGQAGRRVVKRWMERRGLQVWMINNWEEFSPAIERIKQEIFSESFSTSERFDLISPESHVYDSWMADLDAKGFGRTRNSMDASLQRLPVSDAASPANSDSAQKLNLHGARAHLLLIVDITMVAMPLDALCSDLEDVLLEADRPAIFKVVWLVNVNTPSSDIQFLRRRNTVCNLILHKPLYASRLQCIWGLLQDLVGNRVQELCEAPHLSSGHCDKINLGTANSLYTSLSCMSTFQDKNLRPHLMTETNPKLQQPGDFLERNPSNLTTDSVGVVHSASQAGQLLGKSDKVADNTRDMFLRRTNNQRWSPPLTPDRSLLQRSPESLPLSRRRCADEGGKDPQHALAAMHILVAEDNPILQRLTKTQLIRLGATVECVDNGAEAARLVLEHLYRGKVSSSEEDGRLSKNQSEERTESKKNRAFDLVLMDCEMPILNGYEATQRIRMEENRYGVRTPVIALTAHAMAQDEKKCIEAGMDFYLTKPLAIASLLDVVSKIIGGKQSQTT